MKLARLCTLFALYFLANVSSLYAATQTLGGVTSVGELRLRISDLGVIEIARHTGTAFQDFWFSPSSTGNRLQYTDPTQRAFRSAFFGGTAFTTVSNVTDGNTVTTIYNAVQGGDSVRVTQVVTYAQGTDFIGVRWTLHNNYATALNDLRWFYGGDTTLAGNDSGTGFYRVATDTVGVEGAGLSGEFSIRGITPSFGYDAIEFNLVSSHGTAGALTNAASATIVDVGMGMEWRSSTLAAGADWVVEARLVASVAAAVPTATPTRTATPTATPTIAPTVVPTIAPTSIPVPTATGTPIGNVIPGTIRNPDGSPAVGVVVYLYTLQSNAQGIAANAASRTGFGNTTTDSSGFFIFRDVPNGSYRVEPALDDAKFVPSTITTGPGVFLTVMQASQATTPTGCTKDPRMNQIVASDAAGLAQLEFLQSKVTEFLASAKGKLDKSEFASLSRSLNSARREGERDFTRVLRITQSLPKGVLACQSASSCRTVSLRTKIVRYGQRIDDLRRLTLFVNRRTYLALDRDGERSYFAETRKLHKETERLARGLPKKSDVCK